MNSNQIRQKYLEFFKKQGHVIIPSASLVPENDPTTLFTGSGMQPMVPFLLGEMHPKGTRLADSQKCFRSQDFEEVGDNRHTTFFEMLGNWSLGDYFKQEQISWMFEFLTKELGMDPKRLYVTAFRGKEGLGKWNLPRDEESVKLWQTAFKTVGMEAAVVDFSERDGMQNGRIFYYSDKKNWWSRVGIPDHMPSGEPGGPDTEMFWDFGEQLKLHEQSQWKDEPCHVNCDCGRFAEIGNNVFMQYLKAVDGFNPLPKQNVDFGGGLERLAAAVNDDPDMFKIDLFSKALVVLEKAVNQKYGAQPEQTYAFRVILDHVRAAVFLIGDGILPSNKDQGYFVRRLIRHAVRFARTLQVSEALLGHVAQAFITTYAEPYPELVEKQSAIISELQNEEKKFAKSITEGLKELKRIYQETKTFTAKDAFNLYQSFGFPLELTLEELKMSHNMTIDVEQFKQEFKKHQDLSRSRSEQKFAGGLADHSVESTRLHTATHLVHQALRDVLGDQVEQRGSNITQDRLRFDFSHPTKMTPEQIKQVENLVNEQIRKDHLVHFELLTVDEAKQHDAIGLFEDKYAQMGGKIKVYFVGDYSKEICGGPHVQHTGELGGFKITKEEASSAGIRRIKATLGR